MAGSASLRNQKEVVTPPLKGSFLLDREGKCKLEMLDYMLCLDERKVLTCLFFFFLKWFYVVMRVLKVS